MVIPMLKIRRPTGRLIFNMGIPIPGKTVFYIETGPCILFRQSINKKIYNEITDPDGRYIILDIEIEGLRMTLANIYAPNEDDTSFYINVIQLIESLPNDNQIIGGDFNLVLDLEIDKKGERKVIHRNS